MLLPLIVEWTYELEVRQHFFVQLQYLPKTPNHNIES